jgi:hypothetical protein
MTTTRPKTTLDPILFGKLVGWDSVDVGWNALFDDFIIY